MNQKKIKIKFIVKNLIIRTEIRNLRQNFTRMQNNMSPKEAVLVKINEKGSWVNTHGHLDRAYSLINDTYSFTNSYLKEKWHLVDDMKRNSSVDDIYARMERAINHFLEQGAQAIGTFIDVDEVIEDRSMIAAQRLKDNYGKDIEIRFANQVLKGVIDPKARQWFDMSADFMDIIGGLPAKDFGREDEHLDILLSTTKAKEKLDRKSTRLNSS